QDENKVTLMTIHAAKGLEFKTVFIVGLEEELFPSPFAETPRELEEERRLFYVAITRAEEQCFISYSKSRFKNGKTNFANPSRFLKDIDKQYLEYDEPENSIRKPAFSSWDDDVETERNRFRLTLFNRMERNDLPPTPAHRNLKKISNTTDNIIPVINDNLPAGTFVKHAIFGIGKVLSTSLVDGNEKAEIDFGEKGKKSLLLKFAKLEVLK
ncbi:MAG: ATP-dependent helicase PcrA, partial [Bacteroidetes bacterium]|nr:ATP-dependent helicase PcrA [Bacteroidota bacterium]